jgi:hypothetical protein
MARSRHYKELIFNSGPRYKDTAWKLYTKAFGEPVAIIKDMYGDGVDTPVWRKILVDPNIIKDETNP